MAQTIGASGGGARRRLVESSWYTSASVAGALGTGLAAWLVGQVVGEATPISVLYVTLAALGVVVATASSTERWPQPRFQIPRWWVQPTSYYGLVLAGLVIGFGVVTRIRYPLYFLLLALAITIASELGLFSALTLMATYGFVNGVSAGLFPHSSTPMLSHWYQTFQERLLMASTATAFMVVLVSFTLIGRGLR